MERIKLLSSREYWVALVANNLWSAGMNHIVADEQAENIVNDFFMERILELLNHKQ